MPIHYNKTKQQCLFEFRSLWVQAVQNNPRLEKDRAAKSYEWNIFIDNLVRDGQLTQKQVDNWENPFYK